MDRVQFLLLGLPIFLFFTDMVTLFGPSPPPPPPKPHHHPPHHPHPPHQSQSETSQPLEFPTQRASGTGGIGVGNTVNIDFCASCSYSQQVKVMPLEMVADLDKKVMEIYVEEGLVMAGEHIFPRLGFAVPPPWYYTLRANRFGTISSSWLLGNFLQSFLQSSGAFEVHCNGEPVFSKLKEHRFPGEIELKDLIGKRIANSRVLDGLGGAPWS
ncbi:hypothetical protein RJ639_003624 [Escallonia herrerae]|uniref:SelT-like protein n=1 Tax=Escallonia herrerae TaxID=1293975 RepID=A0AA88W0S1_9ASTE|nr:hypothetical protein RJ639_003624 [Escallonia herrerae]